MGYHVAGMSEEVCEGFKGFAMRVACLSWTTASGKIMPLSIKMPNEDGSFDTINEITVLGQYRDGCLDTEQKVFDCSIKQNDRSIRVCLVYHLKDTRWELVV